MTPTSHKGQQPSYPLAKVKELALADNALMITGNALLSAQNCFGWDRADVVKAIRAMRSCDFDISIDSKNRPGTMLDVYKIIGHKKHDIYTHFYIDSNTGFLIINSFKKLE